MTAHREPLSCLLQDKVLTQDFTTFVSFLCLLSLWFVTFIYVLLYRSHTWSVSNFLSLRTVLEPESMIWYFDVVKFPSIFFCNIRAKNEIYIKEIGSFPLFVQKVMIGKSAWRVVNLILRFTQNMSKQIYDLQNVNKLVYMKYMDSLLFQKCDNYCLYKMWFKFYLLLP